MEYESSASPQKLAVSTRSASTGTGTPYVFLDTSKTAERLRFDAAHELGHLVLHCEEGVPHGRDAEQQAHRFASAFLMPKTAVLAAGLHNGSLEQVLRAKKKWRVAAMALAHRLHELHLVSEWRYRELCIELSRRGYRRSEPDGVAPELSQVLGKVLRALRASGVSAEDIADDLGWRLEDLHANVFGLALTAQAGGTQSVPTHPPAVLR